MSSRHQGPFYGWWIVFAAAVGLFCGIPSTVYTFGVFVKPLIQEFHVSRAAISVSYTLWAVMYAVGAPLVGWLIGRFGSRRVIILSLALFGLTLISMKVISADIWQFYLAYGCVGLLSSGVGPISYGNVLSRWFDRRRGLALGLAMLGMGLGAILMPVIAQRLIALFGWRTAYALLGCLVLLLALPMAFVLRENPWELGHTVDGDTPSTGEPAAVAVAGTSVRDAWRSRAFWLMVCAFFLTGAAVQGCVVHLAPMLSDRGLSATTAALGSSLLGAALMIARLGTGYLLDRLFAPRVAILTFGCAAAGIGLVLFGSTTYLALAGAFLIGLGIGGEVDIIPYLISRYFGLRAFAQILGVAFAIFVLSGAVGPLLMGAGFDRSGSYRGILLVFVGTILFSAWLVARLGPYRFSAQVRGGDVPAELSKNYPATKTPVSL